MGQGWGSRLFFPAQRLPSPPCSTPDVPGSRQGLSHCSLEPRCPHPHSGAPLPRPSLIPGTVVQVNEITLQMSHPGLRAGSSGCGRMCSGGLVVTVPPSCPLSLIAAQAAERCWPLTERSSHSLPALRPAVASADPASWTPASHTCRGKELTVLTHLGISAVSCGSSHPSLLGLLSPERAQDLPRVPKPSCPLHRLLEPLPTCSSVPPPLLP